MPCHHFIGRVSNEHNICQEEDHDRDVLGNWGWGNGAGRMLACLFWAIFWTRHGDDTFIKTPSVREGASNKKRAGGTRVAVHYDIYCKIHQWVYSSGLSLNSGVYYYYYELLSNGRMATESSEGTILIFLEDMWSRRHEKEHRSDIFIKEMECGWSVSNEN